MKKIAYFLLAVVMVLPLLVSCGGDAETTSVEVPNVTIVSYANAYSETATGENPVRDESLATQIYSGSLTAKVAEGATLTVKDVVDAYANDLDGGAVYDATKNVYQKLADLSEGNGFFWNYKVNGADAGLSTEIQATDTILIVYEK